MGCYVGEFLAAFALVLEVVSGRLDQVWIYLVVPFLGATLAILSCRLLPRRRRSWLCG